MTRETPFLFGRSHRLVGLLAEPAGGGEGPAVILLNAGLLHRIGPRRIHVKLARQLALRGLSVLRMDLSGIGDSEPRRDGLAVVEAMKEDVREAMDSLAERRGAREFLLFGICSGAKVAFHAALGDPRVAGAVLVDPGDFGEGAQSSPASGDSAYVRHYVRHYWRSVLSKRWTWKRVAGWLTGRANYRYALKVLRTQASGLLRGGRETGETRDRLLADVDRLAARGAKLLLLYGGKGASLVFFDMMLKERLALRPQDGRVDARVLPGATHDFATLDSQEKLLRAVHEWLEPRAAAAAARGPAGASAERLAPAHVPRAPAG